MVGGLRCRCHRSVWAEDWQCAPSAVPAHEAAEGDPCGCCCCCCAPHELQAATRLHQANGRRGSIWLRSHEIGGGRCGRGEICAAEEANNHPRCRKYLLAPCLPGCSLVCRNGGNGGRRNEARACEARPSSRSDHCCCSRRRHRRHLRVDCARQQRLRWTAPQLRHRPFP